MKEGPRGDRGAGDGAGGEGGKGRTGGLGSPLRHLHLGTQIALSLLLGLLGGNWLDERTGWSPIFTLAGTVLGMSLGMTVVIREVGGKKR